MRRKWSQSGACILLLFVMPAVGIADEAAAVRTITQRGGSVTRRGNDPEAPVIGMKLGTTDWDYSSELERELFRSRQHISSPQSFWNALSVLTELETLDLSGDPKHHVLFRPSDQFPTLSRLRKLNLDHCNVDLDVLARFLQQVPHLESLSLIGVEYVNVMHDIKVFPPKAGIDLSILRHSPNLRELILDSLPDFQSLQSVPSLERLRFEDVYVNIHPQDSPEWLQLKERWRHLKELPKLTTVDLPPSVASLAALHEAGILHKFVGATAINRQRPKSAEDVVSFGLSDPPTGRHPSPFQGIVLVDDGVLKAMTSFPRLQSLDLTEPMISNEGLVALQAWPQLRQVSIRYGWLRVMQDESNRKSREPRPEARFYQRISDAGIARIVAIPTLRNLNLTGCRVSDRTLALIRQRPELERLVLQLETVSDADLHQLATLTNLRTLALNAEFDHKWDVTDAGFSALQSLIHLEELDLSGMTISDQSWSVIRHFPRLRHLRISHSSVTRFGLAELSGLKALNTLEIERTGPTNGIDPEALSPLRACRGLTRLWLDQQLITDGVLKVLAECGQLRALSTEPTYDYELPAWISVQESPTPNSPARQLNFSRVEVTDVGIAELASLPDLEELTLYASGVQGPGLKSLANLPRLKSINIPASDDVLLALGEINRIHLLPCMFGRDGGRPRDAADVVRFGTAPNGLASRPLTARGLRSLKPLVNLHTLPAFGSEDTLLALSEIGLLHALPQAKAADGGRPTGPGDVIMLNLKGSRLSDAVFPAILQFTNLRELRMTVPRTTNLLPLAALKRLEILHASDQGNPPRGIVELKKILPDLSIRF